MNASKLMYTIILLLGLTLASSNASAEGAALTKLKNVSGLNVQTSCQTCHGGIPSLNPFGGDFFATSKKINGYAFTLANWTALSTLDSDGDGTDNITEITNGTNPGGTGGAVSTEKATVGGCVATYGNMAPLMLFVLALVVIAARRRIS